MISRFAVRARGSSNALGLALWILLPLCLFALSCGGTPRTDDELIKDLDSARWQIRASAADELGRRRVTRAAARLGTALTDSSEEVRGSAALALGLIGAKSELDKIRKLIDEEDDRQVKVLALYSLADLAAGETGDRLREDIARVESKLDDDSRRVKRAAARVLEVLRGPAKPEPEAARAPRAKRSPDEPPQKRWSFDRIEDRIALSRDGECALTRTLVVRGLQSRALTRLTFYLPAAFPEADSVVDASGTPVEFEFRREGDERQVRFATPPLESGATASFTLTAKSRRPVFADDSDQHLFVYSPGPVDAPTAALRVEVALPAGQARAIDPRDLTLRSEGQGQVASFERTRLSHRALGDIVLKVGIPASALQLPRTPPRYFTRASDLTLAAVVAAIALAILAGLIVWLRRKLGERSHRAILVATLTTGAFLFLTPILIEDNLTYYAMARSAVLDGDLDRVNEFSEMNQSGAFDPDHRGPLDPAFVWMIRTPLLTAADVLTRAINSVSPSHATTGFSFPYLFLTALGDFLAVLLGCLACFSLVERRVGRPYALFAVLAIVAGTNLQLFAYGWTSSSFQPSFFLFAVFLDLWDRTRERRTGLVWLGAGALLGLLAITRTINFGFVLVPFLDWIHTAWTLNKKEGLVGLKQHVGYGALFVAGLLFTYTPQLILQEVVDDTWMVDAYGIGTGRFSGLSEHLSGLLFQRDPNRSDGLLATMPMLALACIGLLPLFRSDRRFATIVTATLALQIYAIASYEIYWGYFWYGTPYLMPSSPILCLGLASFLKFAHVRWGKRGLIAVGAIGVAFVLRTGWCTLWQLGYNLTGEPASDGSTIQVLHAMLMPGRKLDVDVLLNSSEFGCLLRETVGALRAHDFGQLFAALGWVGLLVGAAFLTYAAVTWSGRLAARIAPRTLQRVLVPALALVWIAFVGWAISLGTKTNLDYRLEFETRSAEKREYRVRLLQPGETYTMPIEFEYPGAMSIVTFLDGAVSVPQGSRVGIIEVEGKDKKTSLELRAGIDTADFAIDRPESKSERRHTAPLDRATMTWRVADDSSHLYTARAYRTGFDVPPVDEEFSINMTSTLERGTLAIAVINVVEEKLPRDPSRKRWLSDRW